MDPALPCSGAPTPAGWLIQVLRTARGEDDLRHAEATILADGRFASMYAVTAADGRVLPVVADFGSPQAKQACITAVRMLCIATDGSMSVHMGEA